MGFERWSLWLSEALSSLREQNLLRSIQDRSAPDDAAHPAVLTTASRIRIAGAEFINFGSNDYLGFAGEPLPREWAKKAVDAYGVGASASRLLSGGCALHKELEEAVAEFKGTEAALIFNSGYTANTSAIPALAGEGALILSDAQNHASIIDGARLSRARREVYRHGDVAHLSCLLASAPEKRLMVITDTVFSMGGDIAPLREISEVCAHHGAMLYLDDAHGTGVLGRGRGALSHFSIEPQPWMLQMGTFSKALGSCGAFVAGSGKIIEWLSNRARGFMFSTALPASVVAASLATLRMLGDSHPAFTRLWRNREMLAAGLRERDFDTLRSETPIVPIAVGGVAATLTYSRLLRERGLHVPAIRPPTVQRPHLRATVTAVHTGDDIAALLAALDEARDSLR
jgi:8-amino-7-oxononanoate synthase